MGVVVSVEVSESFEDKGAFVGVTDLVSHIEGQQLSKARTGYFVVLEAVFERGCFLATFMIFGKRNKLVIIYKGFR